MVVNANIIYIRTEFAAAKLRIWEKLSLRKKHFAAIVMF